MYAALIIMLGISQSLATTTAILAQGRALRKAEPACARCGWRGEPTPHVCRGVLR